MTDFLLHNERALVDGELPHAAVDLAARILGGSVVAASDESFGFKENLIDPAEPVFTPGTYSLRGEVVDGWETRRHAGRRGDWVIIRLGVPGRVQTVDVDTRYFAGNHPTAACVDACALDVAADPTDPAIEWTTVAESTPLKPDSHNVLPVTNRRRWTHLRLRLESDGGVARLRAYGEVIPDPTLWEDITVEVSSLEQGGRVEWCSDSFYSDAFALVAPTRPRGMGDGWETRRRRDVGPDSHDAVLISFAAPADLCRLEIDTSYFVFNASLEVAVLGSRDRPDGEHGWALAPFDVPVLPRTRLAPDARQMFKVDARDITALRLQAYPDGGIARVRALGRPTNEGLALLQRRWEESS
ncbi:allantoicase [Mycolicibacterium agri]|uniref:Probable allantoicase n=1 Tax=Mycolicibacterium agri TaxID=36811 RepID=A0A2A7MSE4_MYCAG|nr:allantoicase [Mycolicibacterium agri]PEG34423.1 allantoicase [Mycolicibacterium agri]GFG49947.1 putative allantoicase [Mycolicibacterium agri]